MAFVREFNGIAQQVHDDLAQPSRIAAHHHRHIAADVDDQFDALDGGLHCHGGNRLVDHIAQIEVDFLQFQAIGLDLGQIQHAVDQGEQGLGAAADDVHVLALGVVEGGLGQDLRHADDAIHGRADFVADVGEKIALGAIRGLGAELGIQRGLFGELAVADVDDGAGDARHFTGRSPGHVGLLADPALFAAVQQHSVFTTIVGLIGRGLQRRAAPAREIVRVHPRQQYDSDRRAWSRAECPAAAEIVGADAGVAAEVEIEGGDAGGRLRDVQRLGGVDAVCLPAPCVR